MDKNHQYFNTHDPLYADKVNRVGIDHQAVDYTYNDIYRLMLIAYGQHQDESMDVKYTDIDYHVFTDAARHVYDGGSPYSRHTYRYSPLLAYLMIPNVAWSPNVGKLMFVMFDIFAGYLIYNILKYDGKCMILLY